MKKTGVLVINLGTPDSPSVGDVRKYLSQFLNDPRVIDIPWLSRKMLVNLVIVPFRAPKSAKIYKELWTEEGSPLLLYGQQLCDLLRQALGGEYVVELGMRYQSPSIPNALQKLRQHNPDKIILLPLFPQYASSSTGSALEEALDEVKKWWAIPEVVAISQYWDHPGYIDAFAERGRQYDIQSYDHVLFSYHGLPVRQVDKAHPEGHVCDDRCMHEVWEDNKFCYRATCYATTRLLAEKLNIPREKYTVCFQSRLNEKWLEPFSDKVVEEQAKKGAKRLLAFSPAFTADCLETIVEIGSEYQEIFETNGGEKVQLVESLNTHPLWVNALKDMVLERS